MRKITSLYVFCFLVLLSCSSPQKSLAKKDYRGAYNASLKKLKKNNQNKEYASILNESLSAILVKEEVSAIELKKSTKLKDKVKAVSQYNKLLEMTGEASQFLDSELKNKSSSYILELKSLEEEIGAEYFNLGMQDLKLYESGKSKAKAKSAHKYFTRAKDYLIANDKLDSLLLYSLDKAQKLYIVESDIPIGISSFKVDRILEDLEDQRDKYLKVEYDPVIINRNADCKIVINIESLDIDVEEDTSSKDVDKRVKVDSTRITVEAEIEIIKTTKTSELNINIDVSPLGNKNCDISSFSLSESMVEEIEEYDFTGDERAVPRKYKNSKDLEFKDEDDVLIELLEELYRDIVDEIF